MINGASGGVGTFAVQLAKYYETEVTAVCSASNHKLVKKLGANAVIDYAKEDFTQTDVKYDIIFDCVGKRTFSECKNSLTQKGIFLSTELSFSLFLQILRTSVTGNKKARFIITDFGQEDLLFLKKCYETGKLKTVIDRMYPMSKIVEAHRYAEKGHAKGKIIVFMSKKG